MDYRIVKANETIGQIEVSYLDANGDSVGVWALDVPVVDGVFITGAALDAEIRSRAPVWLIERKAAVTSASNFREIASLVVAGVAPVKDLSSEKLFRKAQVDEYRNTLLASGVEFNGVVFDSDPDSVTRLTAVCTAVAAGAPLPAGFVWRAKDNTDVAMDGAGLVALLGAMITSANEIFHTAWAKKAEIDAATAVEEVKAVTWAERGIPSPIGQVIGTVVL